MAVTRKTSANTARCVGLALYDLVRTQFYVLVPLVNVQIPISSAV